jgi:hypothetical protein
MILVECLYFYCANKLLKHRSYNQACFLKFQLYQICWFVKDESVLAGCSTFSLLSLSYYSLRLLPWQPFCFCGFRIDLIRIIV